MAILFTDNGDKAIELPNKKIMLFSSYQRDYYSNVTAVVAEDLDNLNSYLGDVFKGGVKHREPREFWCAAVVKDAHEKAKLIKEYQNFAKDLDNQNMLPTYSDGWMSRAGKLYPAVRKFLWGY